MRDQQRLRDNIKALTATAEAKQLITRYVSKADTQETRLEQLNKDKQALHEEATTTAIGIGDSDSQLGDRSPGF